MIVSEPVKIEVELEDVETGCTYIYKGNKLTDCIAYFRSMFFGTRPYRILRQKDV